MQTIRVTGVSVTIGILLIKGTIRSGLFPPDSSACRVVDVHLPNRIVHTSVHIDSFREKVIDEPTLEAPVARMVRVEELPENVIYAIRLPTAGMNTKTPSRRHIYGELPVYPPGLITSGIPQPIIQDVINAGDFIHEYPVAPYFRKQAVLTVADKFVSLVDENIINCDPQHARAVLTWYTQSFIPVEVNCSSKNCSVRYVAAMPGQLHKGVI
jgi:hypothetical protein